MLLCASTLSAERLISASSRICFSICLRSLFMSFNSLAMCSASESESVSRQRIPKVMSSSRPAAFKRGPTAKPKSKVEAFDTSRPAILSSAAIPAHILPARMRCKPCATRMRLLWSSLTTSATVPSATKSSNSDKLGSGLSTYAPRLRNSARVAIST